MNSSQTRLLKSISTHSLEIKNPSTYKDFLRRRPKHAFSFKFTMLRSPNRLTKADEFQVQLKLLKALKTVKPMTKVDLKQFEVTNPCFCRTTLPLIFKLISHVKTLFFTRLHKSLDEKYFKHLVRLQRLGYQLDGQFMKLQINRLDQTRFQDPLGYFKYCPKVRALEVLDCSHEGTFTKTPIELKPSLKSFTFTAYNWSESQTNIPLLRNLTSISLYNGLGTEKRLTQIMKFLSTLPDLREINLKIRVNVSPSFVTACKKIAERRMLQKISLHITCGFSSNLQKSLEAFKDCKLTSLSLKTILKKAKAFKFISKLIQNMSHLESLELDIEKDSLFSKDDDIEEICKKISKLQVLSSLRLRFYTNEKVTRSARISNFISYLSDIFEKPIKIQTFRLECNQLDPSEALQSVTSLLESSASDITNLSINFGAFPCTKKIYPSILKLMGNLTKIQVLEIPSLCFKDSKSQDLENIIQAVSTFKYLREFGIGTLQDDIGRSALCQVVETISSKRGLRKFSCIANYGLENNLREETLVINLKKIIERNPHFTSLDFGESFSIVIFFLRILKWID